MLDWIKERESRGGEVGLLVMKRGSRHKTTSRKSGEILKKGVFLLD